MARDPAQGQDDLTNFSSSAQEEELTRTALKGNAVSTEKPQETTAETSTYSLDSEAQLEATVAANAEKFAADARAQVERSHAELARATAYASQHEALHESQQQDNSVAAEAFVSATTAAREGKTVSPAAVANDVISSAATKQDQERSEEKAAAAAADDDDDADATSVEVSASASHSAISESVSTATAAGKDNHSSSVEREQIAPDTRASAATAAHADVEHTAATAATDPAGAEAAGAETTATAAEADAAAKTADAADIAQEALYTTHRTQTQRRRNRVNLHETSSYSGRSAYLCNTPRHKARTLARNLTLLVAPLALLWTVLCIFIALQMHELRVYSSDLRRAYIPGVEMSDLLQKDMLQVAYHADLLAQSMNISVAFANYNNLQALLQKDYLQDIEPIKPQLAQLRAEIDDLYEAKSELHYRTKQIFNTWLVYFSAVENFCILTGQVGVLYEIAMHDHSVLMHGYKSLAQVINRHTSTVDSYVRPQCQAVLTFFKDHPDEIGSYAQKLQSIPVFRRLLEQRGPQGLNGGQHSHASLALPATVGSQVSSVATTATVASAVSTAAATSASAATTIATTATAAKAAHAAVAPSAHGAQGTQGTQGENVPPRLRLPEDEQWISHDLQLEAPQSMIADIRAQQSGAESVRHQSIARLPQPHRAPSQAQAAIDGKSEQEQVMQQGTQQGAMATLTAAGGMMADGAADNTASLMVDIHLATAGHKPSQAEGVSNASALMDDHALPEDITRDFAQAMHLTGEELSDFNATQSQELSVPELTLGIIRDRNETIDDSFNMQPEIAGNLQSFSAHDFTEQAVSASINHTLATAEELRADQVAINRALVEHPITSLSDEQLVYTFVHEPVQALNLVVAAVNEAFLLSHEKHSFMWGQQEVYNFATQKADPSAEKTEAFGSNEEQSTPAALPSSVLLQKGNSSDLEDGEEVTANIYMTNFNRNEKFLFTCRAYNRSYSDLLFLFVAQQQAMDKFKVAYSQLLETITSVNQLSTKLAKKPVATVAVDVQHGTNRLTLLMVLVGAAALFSVLYVYFFVLHVFIRPTMRLRELVHEFNDTFRVPDPREVSTTEGQDIIDTLRPIMENYGTLVQRNIDLKKLNSKLGKLYYLDGLTHLYNHQALEEIISQIPQIHNDSAILMIDVDHLYDYCLSQGQIAGDEALALIASTIKANIAPERDLLFRYSGDEFCLFLSQISYHETIMLCDHLLQKIESLNLNYQRQVGANSATTTAQEAALRMQDRVTQMLHDQVEVVPAAAQDGAAQVDTDTTSTTTTTTSAAAKRYNNANLGHWAQDLAQETVGKAAAKSAETKEHVLTISIGVSYIGAGMQTKTHRAKDHIRFACQALALAKCVGESSFHVHEIMPSLEGDEPQRMRSDYEPKEREHTAEDFARRHVLGEQE